MERAAAAGLRRCLRVRTTGSCTVSKSLQAKSCIASSICPSRTLSSISNPPITRRQPSNLTSTSSLLPSSIPRSYSTSTSISESSIQGTIGKGEAGIQQEAAHTASALAAPAHLNEKERQIWEMLMAELECTELEVSDISGGCGSMYGIDIVSEKFRGLSMLKQQRLVNKVLGEEIKGWHGVQLKTRAP